MKSNSSFPLISIIVPVYNVGEYVSKCLISIIEQTYKNLEIIVIDDGSTDKSGLICDELSKQDNRILVIHQPNGGLGAARNKGLSLAKGKYIGFVDSDDWIDTDMYEFLYNLLIENEADISICSHYIEKPNKTKVKYFSNEIQIFSRNNAIRSLVEDTLVRNYAWDKLYKRSLFDGIRFPLNRFFEDIAVCYKIFHKTKQVVMQSHPKYHYLVREDSIMGSKYNPVKEHHLFLSVYEQNKFVEENNLWDKASIYVLQRGIRLIDHTIMLHSSPVTDEIIEDVLEKIHEYDNVKFRQLGIFFSIKRYFIYKHVLLYRFAYRCFRLVFKPRRYKY